MSARYSIAEAESAERSNRINGALTGTLLGFMNAGQTALVTYPGQPGTDAIAARAVVELNESHLGREVVLMFDAGDPLRPLVMGVVRVAGERQLSEYAQNVSADVDGARLVVTAQEQIVLRCGQASITLTREGKVLIYGAYVCTRSSGVNRIKGASIQLN